MIKIRRNFKISEGKPLGTKGAQKQRNLCSCKNFAAKRAPLRKGASPAKSFRSQKNHPAKLGFCCEKRVPLRNGLRNLPKQDFVATSPPAKFFTTAKPPLGTRVPFCSPQNPFRNCEIPFCCEIILCLRNGPPPAKIPTVI